MSKRVYTLTGDAADRVQEQIEDLTWPDGSPIRLGDFGSRLKISGILFQGEGCREVLILTPNADGSSVGFCPDCGLTTKQPDLETWCDIVFQTDDPVIFEQDSTGTIKAIQRKVQFAISGGTQWAIWERDDFRCIYCGQHGGRGVPLTVDHWIPVEQGGKGNSENVVSSCRRCNKEKGSQDPIAFCEAHGYDAEGIILHMEGKAPMSFIGHLA